MPSISVEVHDRRHTVNVSPMAPLSAVVEAALSAEGVQITHPSACKLLLGKKEMDLSTPLRFANLPTGAKLQLITGQERRLGMGEPVSAPRLPELPTKAASTPRAADAATAPYTMAPDSSQLTTGAAAFDSSPGSPSSSVPAHSSQQAAPASQHLAAAPAGIDGGGSRADPAAASTAQPAVSSRDDRSANEAPNAAAAAGADDAAAGPQPDPRSNELLGRAAWVFSRAAAQEAAAEATSVEDPPDSFYEFTADDYTRVARGWGANTATGPAANAPLKTARMRAADAAAAAQKVGPVPVRVYGFGNDMALQATLSATDPVSALQELVVRACLPATAGLQLYTAPPKAVLQQPQATLYEADLAPAAVVYVSCAGGEPPALRPEVAALQGPPPPRARQQQSSGGRKRQAGAAAKSQPGLNGASATQQKDSEAAAADAPRTASGAKLPKWLKPKK